MAPTSSFKTDAPDYSQVPKTFFDSPTTTRATTTTRSCHEHFASLQRVIVAHPIHAACNRPSSSAQLTGESACTGATGQRSEHPPLRSPLRRLTMRLHGLGRGVHTPGLGECCFGPRVIDSLRRGLGSEPKRTRRR